MGAVISATMEQIELAANTPPDKVIVSIFVIGAVVTVTVPPHCDEAALVTFMPEGRVSINPIPSRGKFPVFSMVIVNVDEFPVPARIGFGKKNLLRLAPGRLVNVADAGCVFVAPLVVVTAPAPIVLVRLLFTFIVVLTDRVQLAFANRLPPLNENEVLPGVAVIVPPQVPVEGLGGLATVMPPPVP